MNANPQPAQAQPAEPRTADGGTTRYVSPPGLLSSPAFNHAVLKAGRPVHIAGQLALAEDGSVVGEGDVTAQSERVWQQVRAVVEAAGGTMADLVKITTYITEADHVAPVLESRVRQFPTGQVPASALLIVKALARPEFLVEIEAVALVEDGA